MHKKALDTKVVTPDGSTEYEKNNNSNKYNWNEEFVQKMADKIFKWFNDDHTLWFYSDFPRIDLKITFNQFLRKMSEFPLVWDDIHSELKLITTTRLATAMLKNRVSVPGAIQALKNMGDKWNDKTDVNLNVKSIGELISDAWSDAEDIVAGKSDKLKEHKKAKVVAEPLTEEEKALICKDIDKL